jgi:ribulose-phosphate 3-epimerase
MIKISPSILACDFARLGEEIESIRLAGAEMAHLDVMDGIFVTNISFGLPVIESIRKSTSMFLDVHLMITKPERYIERFIDAGADLVTFHIEATDCPDKCLEIIRSRGKKAAISVKPNTPVEDIYPYLDRCDMILVMTVEPGYGGQALIPECLEKVKKLKAEIDKRGLAIDIQVDGGINEKNADDAKSAGANVLVAGSAVFKYEDRKTAVDKLR